MRPGVPPGGAGPASGRLRALSRGTSGAVEAMRRFEQASRRAGTAAERAGAQARDSMGRARDSRGRFVGGDGAGGGMGRMFALQQVASTARRAGRALRTASGQTVTDASERQTARAEMRTVVERRRRTGAGTHGSPRGCSWSGRYGGAHQSESDFTNAVFAGVASGLKRTGEPSTWCRPAANLGLAGQATTAQAQIGLTQFQQVFPRRRLSAKPADMIAKAQDMFAFPGGLTETNRVDFKRCRCRRAAVAA